MSPRYRIFGGLFAGMFLHLACAVAQNPTSNVTLNGPDDATVEAGTYSTPATYWNGAITVVNYGAFLLESGWEVGLDFQSQWTGGSSNNGLTAANGQNAGDAGYLTATNNGSISLFGAGTPGPVYGVRFAMLGGIGGLGAGNDAAGSGGSANVGVIAVNAGSIQVGDSLAGGGSAFYAGAIGGDGGNTEENGRVGAGGDALGPGYAAVTLTNSGGVSVGASTSVATGSAGYSAITALAQGGSAGVRQSGSPVNGDPSATGGDAGSVSLTNSGTVGIWWQATGTEAGEVFGIKAASVGGAGADSGNNGTSAGAGGSADAVTVTISSGAQIEAVRENLAVSGSAANLEGAAVAAISRGGEV